MNRTHLALIGVLLLGVFQARLAEASLLELSVERAGTHILLTSSARDLYDCSDASFDIRFRFPSGEVVQFAGQQFGASSLLPPGAHIGVANSTSFTPIVPRIKLFAGRNGRLWVSPNQVEGHLRMGDALYRMSAGSLLETSECHACDLAASQGGPSMACCYPGFRCYDSACGIENSLDNCEGGILTMNETCNSIDCPGPLCPEPQLWGYEPEVRVFSVALDVSHGSVEALGGNPIDAIDSVLVSLAAASDLMRRDLSMELRVVYAVAWTATAPWETGGAWEPNCEYCLVSPVFTVPSCHRQYWRNAINGTPQDPGHDVASLYHVNGNIALGTLPTGDLCANSGLHVALASTTAPTTTAHEYGHAAGSMHHSDYEPPIITSVPEQRLMEASGGGGGFHPCTQRKIRSVQEEIACLPKVPHAKGDYNRDGSIDASDFDSFFSCVEWGFPAAGCLSTFDFNNDEAITCVDHDQLAARSGTPSLDCNGNLVPDGLEVDNGTAIDCNGNCVPDSCDIAAGFSVDCNANGQPDDCDISSGFSIDTTFNGIPDECDPPPPQITAIGSRYLRIDFVDNQPPLWAAPAAIRVFDGDNCVDQFVAIDGTLTNEPLYRTPVEWGSVIVRGDSVVPRDFPVYGFYRAGFEGKGAEASASQGLALTWEWADVNNDGARDSEDVQLVLEAFRGSFVNTTLQATDLLGCTPDQTVNFADIQAAVAATQNQQLDFFQLTSCPDPCQ